ncbi:MAG: fatty acid desaturase [Gammaproteobacteria bacterium]|nr:fatty acid desaturase [Gammaproteobacteria bacterium]
MNPITQDFKDVPALAQARKNLRIDWYRCSLDRATLRELSQPNDLLGATHAVGHLTLLVLTGIACWYLFTQQAGWGFAAALFIHGTIASFLTAPHHEMCHGTVFKTKWLNELFLRIVSLIGWLNFPVYKFSHSYHHRFTLFPAADREEVLPVEPSLRVLFLLQLFTFNITGGYQSRGLIPTLKNFIKLACNRFDNPFNSWGSELYADHPEEQAKAARWARTVLLFHTGVIVVSIAAGQPVIALIVCGAVFIANWHRYFVGVAMHCGLRSNVPDFRKCVRTITLNPFTEFLYWHMNWHLEHHMYAAVPCYRLKRLHQAVAHDMPAPRTLLGAWQEMRTTWQRQRIDPGYEFDTPVPPPACEDTAADQHAVNAMASSIADLAPQVLASELRVAGLRTRREP